MTSSVQFVDVNGQTAKQKHHRVFQEPGRKLTAGTYPVHYVAMDPYRNRAKCSFTITVEGTFFFVTVQLLRHTCV